MENMFNVVCRGCKCELTIVNGEQDLCDDCWHKMAMAVDGPFWTKEDQEKEMAKYGCETCTANIKYDGQCAGCTNPELFAARCDSYWGVQKVVSLHVSNVHKPYCMYCLRETHDELGDFGDTCKECADKRLQKMMEDLSSKEENWDF